MSTEYTHFSQLAFDRLFARGPDGSETVVINSSGTFVGSIMLTGALSVKSITTSSNAIFLGKLKVGTSATLQTAAEGMSLLYSLTSPQAAAQSGLVLNAHLNSTSVNGQTLRGMYVLPQRTSTDDVTDTAQLVGAVFQPLINISSGKTYTNNNSNGITNIQIARLSLNGSTGSITSDYTGALFSTDTTVSITGRKAFLRFQNLSGGSAGNAHITDNLTYSGNYFIHSTSTNESFLSGHLNIAGQKELRLQDTTGGEYVGLRASGTQTTYTVTLPSSAPSSKTALFYDGTNYVWQSLDTNPTSYTPTIVGCGTVSSASAFYSRQGAFVYIYGSFTAGTPTATTMTISLPANHTINTSLLTGTGIYMAGHIYRATGSSNNLPGTSGGPFPLSVNTSATGTVYVSTSTITSSGVFEPANGDGVLGSGNVITFEIKVPITEYAL